MNNCAILAPEWERIDLLGSSLVSVRQGKAIPDDIGHRLGVIQQEVLALREQPLWQDIAIEYQLDSLDQDILACSLAPEVKPRLGWMYQELQPGIVSTFPTPALLREMLLMEPGDSLSIAEHLSTSSPLVSHKLVEHHSGDNFFPIRPAAQAYSRLLGWNKSKTITLPGAVQIPVTGSWDDLVLPPHCLQSMREFMLWVTQRNKVVEQWKGRITGGPIALFAGPSGTGKTFAAEVLANAFELPLFRVDLGLLVSKYIGETEKNLNALFDSAQGCDVLLLFDEADSLFGKRGEVKEARDRYANMEVSHLLSRIERYQGPCILTTNLRQHLDTAFTRRFQMVVEFPRPNEIARSHLWQIHLPSSAPYDDGVSTEILGREVNMTGGQIRNAALHAAYLAAGEESVINMVHITRAIWNELAKAGGEMMTGSLGELACYLPRELIHAQH